MMRARTPTPSPLWKSAVELNIISSFRKGVVYNNFQCNILLYNTSTHKILIIQVLNYDGFSLFLTDCFGWRSKLGWSYCTEKLCCQALFAKQNYYNMWWNKWQIHEGKIGVFDLINKERWQSDCLCVRELHLWSSCYLCRWFREGSKS